MKDVLCLLAIFFAYGLAGHLDYRDAVAMEAAMREDLPQHCPVPTGTGAAHKQLSPTQAMPVHMDAPVAHSPSACWPNDQDDQDDQ